MLTEQETDAMCGMVNELERLAEYGGAGSAGASFKLAQLAKTTGDEWYALVRQYLDEREKQQ